MRTIPNCSGIFFSLIKPLGTVTNQNKAFFFLHTSVADTFEFKEILCFHSLNCIYIQIAFTFKLKVSLTCLFNCRTIFPTFLMIFYFSDSKYWYSFYILSPFYFSFIKINRNTFFNILRHCNISFSETSVAMLDITVISNVGLFAVLLFPASFS